MAKKPPEIEDLVKPKGPVSISADDAEAIRRENGEKLSVNQLVKPSGDGYDVFSESGKAHVSRDLNSTVCTCDDYDGATTMGIADYKCEHIYAVKHFTMFMETKEQMPTKEQDIEFDGDTMKAVETKEYSATEPEDSGSFISRLSRPLPKSLIKEREMPWKKGSYLQYVDWPTVADILDKIADTDWSFEIINVNVGDAAVYVHCSLTVFGVRRDGIGVSEVRTTRDGQPLYETAIKAAASDSLKRAAVLFGVARELYKHEEEPQGEQTRAANFAGSVQSGGTNGSPIAASLGDMITAKQLGMIRAIANEAGINVEEECNRLMSCSVEELSKRGASDLIGHLQQSQRGSASPQRARW